MIVAKQLDLPEGPSGARDAPSALPMPRTQLTRELEKYSRPAASSVGSALAGTPPVRDFGGCIQSQLLGRITRTA